MNRYKSHNVPLLPSHAIWRRVIIWLMELHAKRNTNWLSWNIYFQEIHGTRPHTPITNMNGWKNNLLTPCTDCNTCTNKSSTLILANYTLEKSTYRIEQLFRWMEIRNWNSSNSALCAFRFSQVYSSLEMKILKLNTNFNSQQRVYRFAQVDRWNERYKIDPPFNS